MLFLLASASGGRPVDRSEAVRSNCHSGRKRGTICLFSCQKTLPKCFLLFNVERMSGVQLTTARLLVYSKHGRVTFLASRGVSFPELTFLEGQHSSRYPTHLNLVSSERETWASRLTEPHRLMCVFSCIPLNTKATRKLGWQAPIPLLPPAFPSAPSYSQHHCLNSVCSRTNFSGAGELEVLSEQAPPKRDRVPVLGERRALPRQGLHELDANDAVSRRGGASSILIGRGWDELSIPNTWPSSHLPPRLCCPQRGESAERVCVRSSRSQSLQLVPLGGVGSENRLLKEFEYITFLCKTFLLSSVM